MLNLQESKIISELEVQEIQQSEKSDETILKNNEIFVKLYETEKIFQSIAIQQDSTVFQLIEFIKQDLKFDIDLQKGIQSLKDPNIVLKNDYFLSTIDTIYNLIKTPQLELIIFREVHDVQQPDKQICVYFREMVTAKEYQFQIDPQTTLKEVIEYIDQSELFTVDLSKGFQSMKNPDLFIRCIQWTMDQISIILNSPDIKLNIWKQSTSFQIEINIFDKRYFLEADGSTTIQDILECFEEIENFDKSKVDCFDVNNNLLELQAKCNTLEVTNNKIFLKIQHKI